LFLQDGPIVYGVEKKWNPLLEASAALKIGKNGLEARKLQPFKIGGIDFTENSQLFSS
jgi:hypothetical protein